MYKNESARNRSIKHNRGDGVSSILDPVRGIRDAQKRKGIKPINHAAENKRALRQAQIRNREEKARRERELSYRPVDPYSHVKSKYKSASNKGKKTKKSSAKLLHSSRSSSSSNLNSARRPSSVSSSRPSTGRTSILRKPGSPVGPSEQTRKGFGEVPDYLIQRKREMYEEEKRKEEEEAAMEIPPGMRLMPEDEKKETLAVLHENKVQLEGELRKLPLVVETMGQRRRQEALDAKLKEVDQAITTFSKKTVYISDE